MSTFYFDDSSSSVTKDVRITDKIVATFSELAYPLSVEGTPSNTTVTPSSIASTDADFTADFSNSTAGSSYSFTVKNGVATIEQASFEGGTVVSFSGGARFNTTTGGFTTWGYGQKEIWKDTDTLLGVPVPNSAKFSSAISSGLSSWTSKAIIQTDPITGNPALRLYSSIRRNLSTGSKYALQQAIWSEEFDLEAGDYVVMDSYHPNGTGGFLGYLLNESAATWTSINTSGVSAAGTYRIVLFSGVYFPSGDTNETESQWIRKFTFFNSSGLEGRVINFSGTVSGDPGAIIESTQVQEVGDSIVHLFDITFPAPISQTVHLHNGLDFDGASGQNLYFSTEDGQTLNEYVAFPIAVEGVEIKAGSPGGRPSLAIANLPVLSRVLTNNTDGTEDEQSLDDILTEVGLDSAEGFLYAEVLCRSTLLKYTSRAGDSASLPIEYPKYKFIIDRIAREESGAIVFDLATPADLDNVLLPNRKVVGKYCSWEYQGALFGRGGCTAPGNVFGKFFDEYDQLITADIANSGISTWSSGTSYSVGTRVKKVLGGVAGHGWRIYDCLVAHSGKNPEDYPFYWKRVDTCGKRIRSCKLRFQGKTSELAADEATLAGTVPDDSYLNENQALPFGGFPGSKKFK